MNVIIAGGASGIGAAVVDRFLADGASVAVFDNADGPARKDVLSTRVDVVDRESVGAAVADLCGPWDGIDVVVNCAGVSEPGTVRAVDVQTWRRIIDVNLTGSLIVAQAAFGYLNKHASVVNIASVSGVVGMPGYGAYNASKAGLIELTKTMALEWAPAVRVNSISPGYVLTPMQQREYTEDEIQASAAKIPIGRWGLPSEIAHAVAYLASPQAGFVTGHNLIIDGGETAGGLASRN